MRQCEEGVQEDVESVHHCDEDALGCGGVCVSVKRVCRRMWRCVYQGSAS